MSTEQEVITTEAVGREKCPGQLTWSAFGAWYPDTVCSSALTWTEGANPGGGVLCDADDGLRPKGIPCPFCDPAGFLRYEWGRPDEYELLWAEDESPVPSGTEVHFHDGTGLTWTATHPTRGEREILIRSLYDDTEDDAR